jgi:hypothetical protein
MTRGIKLLLSMLLALAVLLAFALTAIAWWVSGDGLRTQIEEAASKRLGVAVQLEKISLDVWPLPSLALQGLVIQTQPRLSAQRIEARPAWGSLISVPRQLEVLSLHLQGVMLPQRGIDQVQQALSKRELPARAESGQKANMALKTQLASERSADAVRKQDAATAPALLIGLLTIPQRITLDDVTWQSTAGEPLTLSGAITLSEARDVAELDISLAGGTLRGPLRMASVEGLLPSSSKASLKPQLSGTLTTRGVSLAALPGVGARMSGRLNATTTLEAQAAQLSRLDEALQTRTQFNVSGAVIKGIDLAKAVRTLGLSRGGETALSQLSGNLSTRGSGPAMQITLSDLEAASSLLKASGAVNVGAAASAGGPRPLSGKVNVDLNAPDGGTGVGQAVGQLVGIPLEISGTTASPTVAPTRGAMIGGAIGSVMAPVIGTGAGAKLGDKVGEKLGNLKEKLFGK